MPAVSRTGVATASSNSLHLTNIEMLSGRNKKDYEVELAADFARRVGPGPLALTHTNRADNNERSGRLTALLHAR
jgi:hypothetical protein